MKRYTTNGPRPFLKWVGGKTQLLPALEARLPLDFFRSVRVYAEPFVGGGAFLFRLLEKGMRPERVIINDSNCDLANAYRTVRDHSTDLIAELEAMQSAYRSQADEVVRKEFFLRIRAEYNRGAVERDSVPVRRTAQLLFLNRTCFNGLYRVNARGDFNVPFGRYVNPRICDEETIRADAAALAGTEILDGDFADALAEAGRGWFVYLDPPYRPLSRTSSFCDYTQGGFNDGEQRRLASVCRELDARRAKWLLSNSDPKGTDPGDSFFEDLYAGFDIRGVRASRMLNADPTKRGKLGELLISNYTEGELL